MTATLPRRRRRPGQRRIDRRARRVFLPEVQALRAWAVGLVVAFHLWPDGVFRGGFVGVDAFFVISGYLITAHLVREVEETGRIRLGEFYARRARRLLPAALLVLLVSALLTVLVMPADTWHEAAAEILASTAYVQNLWLAGRAVSYSAQGETASMVQHYWSLSTEEQFYLVWPSLILLAVAVSRRWRPRQPGVVIGATLLLVAASSLVCSVVWAAQDAAAAYFVTPTRVWEFAAGAVLPFVLRRWAPPGPFAVVLRHTGLALLVTSAMVLTTQVGFPGAVALWPVVGAVMVIVAGDCEGQDRADVFVTNPVSLWLGDISYSIYLWHWPLVVALPYLAHGHVVWWHRLAVVVATLVLSHLSRRYVEDVTGRIPRVRARTRATLVGAAAAMAVVALASGGLAGASAWADHQRQTRVDAVVADPCSGARAALDLTRCPGAFTRPPTVAVGPGDSFAYRPDECTGDDDRLRVCTWGSGSRTIALVGDSHAEQLSQGLYDVARKHGWRVRFYITWGCPAVDGDMPTIGGTRRKDPGACRRVTAERIADIRRDGADVIVTSDASRRSPVAQDPDAAYHRTWRQLAAIAPVVVVGDSPSTLETTMPACLAQHAADPRSCSHDRGAALAGDQLLSAARSLDDPRVRFLDLTDTVCDVSRCYAVVGGLPVYLDHDHLSGGFVRTLAPELDRTIGQALAR